MNESTPSPAKKKIENELEDFIRFARNRINDRGVEPLNLFDLMDEWMLAHPTEAEIDENVAAIQAALDDYSRGERGRPAGELIRE